MYNKTIYMNINELIAIVKNKLESKISVENIIIQDKSFLHKSHKNHQDGKYHLKLFIKSKELSNFTKLEATKKIYNILDEEIKKEIHSIQISIN